MARPWLGHGLARSHSSARCRARFRPETRLAVAQPASGWLGIVTRTAAWLGMAPWLGMARHGASVRRRHGSLMRCHDSASPAPGPGARPLQPELPARLPGRVAGGTARARRASRGSAAGGQHGESAAATPGRHYEIACGLTLRSKVRAYFA
jgi:hypothetical protein